jgi:demethylmenaquinone methyltransferase/2-methoxy-6-polyprenyl-1,4-benzoquinol methylase
MNTSRTVRPRFDPESIRELFDEMSATYGSMNLVTSFGFSAMWRNQVIRRLPHCKPAHVFDLMSGMGELWRSVSKHLPTTSHLTAIDISPEMVRRAKSDYRFELKTHVLDVLTRQYQPASADAIVCSFGLKTFDRDQIAALAAIVQNLFRPGGAFSFVEISVPKVPILRPLYMFYLSYVIPMIGRIFLGNPDNYRMLGIYTEFFGDCRHFADCLQSRGLHVEFVTHFFGCATGVRGIKPNDGKSETK